jgi:hypothetical protein
MNHMRAMTAKERSQLEGFVAARRDGGRAERLGVFLVSLIVGPAVFGGVALVLLAALATLFGLPISNGAWRENPVTYFGAIGVVGAIWAALALSGLKWLLAGARSRANDVAAMTHDLHKGVVRDEVYQVAEVKRLREPEHGMAFLFLRLSHGRTFVFYDHDAGMADDANREPLIPCARFHLVTFPKSARRVWGFSGERLPLPKDRAMAAGPDRWPEDEAWCRVKWENIERHWGAGSGD